MPIHDWTRVPAGIYHHFHGMWIGELCRSLNHGVLPKGYYALIEQTTRTMGPDVLTLQRPTSPPVSVSAPGGPVSAVATPPRVRFTSATTPKPIPQSRKRVAVRHVSEHRMVAMIELVSPSNKAGKGFQEFIGKVTGAIQEGVHVLVIDPFPPGRRNPNGIHGVVWKELAGEAFTLPPDKPLTLAAYAAGTEIRCFVEPVSVGEVLPDMPLFLESEAYVEVALEATYQSAWRELPEPWPEMLA